MHEFILLITLPICLKPFNRLKYNTIFFLFRQGSSCCNGYRKTNAHEGVRKLHLNGNPIRDWNEICRLGRVFPKLEALVLADCPLRFVNIEYKY